MLTLNDRFRDVKRSPSLWNGSDGWIFLRALSNPSDMAPYMALLSAFFFSGRASVIVMMPAAISVFTCWGIDRSFNQVPWNSGLLLPGGRFISNMFSVLTSR